MSECAKSLGVLWYISRADLSKPGDAPTLHSREDARALGGLGWDVILLVGASGAVEHDNDIKEVIVQRMNVPMNRLLYELKVAIRVLRSEDRPKFVLFRGPTNLILIGVLLKYLAIPFGVEINGVAPYRCKESWSVRDRFQRFAESFFSKHAKVIVAVTEELASQAKRESPPGAIVVTARNGVNVSTVKSLQYPSNPAKFTIGFLGKAYEGRGLGLAIDVIKRLNEDGINCHLVVAGGGPELMSLWDKAKKIGMAEKVQFYDAVPPYAMGELVADCNVMWANYQEDTSLRLSGLSPLKIWTYLALGRPVLVSDLPILASYKDVPGLLWMSGEDPDSLAKQVSHFLRTHGQQGLETLGRRGRDFVERECTWDVHGRKISAAIDLCLSEMQHSMGR